MTVSMAPTIDMNIQPTPSPPVTAITIITDIIISHITSAAILSSVCDSTCGWHAATMQTRGPSRSRGSSFLESPCDGELCVVDAVTGQAARGVQQIHGSFVAWHPTWVALVHGPTSAVDHGGAQNSAAASRCCALQCLSVVVGEQSLSNIHQR